MNKYKVITLCGSTKFKDEFERVYKRLSLEGYIVLTVAYFGHTDSPEVFTKPGLKEMLVDMHKEKIKMSDGIFVINPGDYIGESTKNEIEFAEMLCLEVVYLESPSNKKELTILDKMVNVITRYSANIVYTRYYNEGVKMCIEKLPMYSIRKPFISPEEHKQCCKVVKEILDHNEKTWSREHRIAIDSGILECLNIVNDSIDPNWELYL